MRLRHVDLRAADPASLRPFYAESLGLPVVDTADGFVVAVGDATVQFRPGEGDPTYHLAFSAPGGTAAAAADWLADRAEVLAHEGSRTVDYDWLDATAVYFADPAGNVLELLAREGRGGPDAFGPDALLDVAEVGLVVDDVVGFGGRLVDAFDVSGSPDESFAYLGGREGAFVVAAAGRPWFPTDAAAEPHPVTVVATGAVDPGTTVSAPGIAVVGVDGRP